MTLIDNITSYIPINYLSLLLQKYDLQKNKNITNQKLFINFKLEFWRRIAEELKQFKIRQNRLKLRYSALSYSLLPSYQFIVCVKYFQELLENTNALRTNPLQISQKVVVHNGSYFPSFQRLKFFDNYSKKESKQILFAKVHPSYRLPFYDIKNLHKKARCAMALIY